MTGLVTTGTEDKVSEGCQSIQGTSTQLVKLHNHKNYRFSLKKWDIHRAYKQAQSLSFLVAR